MKIKGLIDNIKTLPNCEVYPANGLPKLENGNHKLPSDIIELYQNCGGITLFSNESCVVNIVPPNEFVLANPIIVGELCEEDITSEWYIIADDGNGDYLTIDLSKNRIGRCYESFWDSHGVVGECPIIANTFTELLEMLISDKGMQYYWLDDEFVSLGDAYDDVK